MTMKKIPWRRQGFTFFVRDYLYKIIAPDESPRQLPKYDKGENDERCLALRSRNRFTVISIIEFKKKVNKIRNNFLKNLFLQDMNIFCRFFVYFLIFMKKIKIS